MHVRQQPLSDLTEAARRAAATEFDGAGWLAHCEQSGVFQVVTRPLVIALRDALATLGATEILEVAAGDGTLAAALQHADLLVRATDVNRGVSAADALSRYRPTVVLSCFAPSDSSVDADVLGFPTVEHYLVLNARCGPALGSPALWQTPGWSHGPLPDVTSCMLTRYDVPLDPDGTRWVRHGEAWRFSREPSRATSSDGAPPPPAR